MRATGLVWFVSTSCFHVFRDIDLDKNKDFWNDIVIIVEDELHKLRRLDTKYDLLIFSQVTLMLVTSLNVVHLIKIF